MPENKSLPQLQRLIETLGDLPSSPAVVSAVIGLTRDLNTDLNQLGKVLSADQALTAKVLRLSNSSFYGRLKKVGTINEAIMILGFYTLRSLVIASSTHSLYQQKDPTKFLPILWEHSLGTAVAARLLGQKVRHPQHEEAFICGLLHDIGKLVMTQKLPGEYALLRRLIGSKFDWRDAEQEQFGYTHVDVGVLLLEKWNFPRILIDAIALHHTEPEADPGRPATIAQLVWIANPISASILGSAHMDEDMDWEKRFHNANIPWDATRIGEFFNEFQENYEFERKLFSTT